MQFNANAKMQTDRVNLDEFTRFGNAINQRESAITTQKKFDDNASIQRMLDKDTYDQREGWISNTFNPSQYGQNDIFNRATTSRPDYNNMSKEELEKLIMLQKLQGREYGGAVKKPKISLKKKKKS